MLINSNLQTKMNNKNLIKKTLIFLVESKNMLKESSEKVKNSANDAQKSNIYPVMGFCIHQKYKLKKTKFTSSFLMRKVQKDKFSKIRESVQKDKSQIFFL